MIRLNGQEAMTFLQGIMYFVKICKPTYYPYIVLCWGHVYTAYSDREAQDVTKTNTFLGNIDITYFPQLQNIPQVKVIQEFVSLLIKYKILNSHSFTIPIIPFYNYFNTIVKEKRDKKYTIHVEIGNTNMEQDFIQSHHPNSGVFPTYVNMMHSYYGETSVTTGEFFTIDKIQCIDTEQMRILTGMQRKLIPLPTPIDQVTYKELSKQIYTFNSNLTPIAQYILSPIIADVLLHFENPLDIDISKPDIILCNMTVSQQKLIPDKLSGIITISKNMILKEFVSKTPQEIILTIYKINGYSNMLAFRFQTITDGMIISSDGMSMSIQSLS